MPVRHSWININATWPLTVTQAEHDAMARMLDTCDGPLGLWVFLGRIPGQRRATSTPAPRPPAEPMARTFKSCDAAQAAGRTRVQGSTGSGRGFPKLIVPSVRDGDGDSVVCEKWRSASDPRRTTTRRADENPPKPASRPNLPASTQVASTSRLIEVRRNNIAVVIVVLASVLACHSGTSHDQTRHQATLLPTAD